MKTARNLTANTINNNNNKQQITQTLNKINNNINCMNNKQ